MRALPLALVAGIAAALSVPSPLRADDADPPSTTFALRGARVERGDGTFVEDAVMLVRDGVVEALGSAADTDLPAGMPVMDARGGHVLPGFVLPMARLGVGAPRGNAERATPTESVRDELDPFSPSWALAADHGVAWLGLLPGPGAPAGEGVTVRPADAGTDGFVVDGGRFLRVDVAATTGWVRGVEGVLGQAKKEVEAEDKYAAEKEAFLAAKAEYDARKAAHDAAVKAHGEAEAAAKAEAEKEKKPAPAPTPPPAPPADLKPPAEPKEPKSDERTAIVRDAVRRRVPVFVVCGSDTDVDRALETLRPWRLRLVFWAAGDAWRLADRVAGADGGAVVQPGPVNRSGTLDRINPAAVFRAAGCTVGLAPSWENRTGLRMLPVQVGELVHDGLPRADAVRALTSAGAELLGIGDRAGRLAPGRSADMVLFDGDPFEGTSRPVAVWHGGVPRRGGGE